MLQQAQNEVEKTTHTHKNQHTQALVKIPKTAQNIKENYQFMMLTVYYCADGSG